MHAIVQVLHACLFMQERHFNSRVQNDFMGMIESHWAYEGLGILNPGLTFVRACSMPATYIKYKIRSTMHAFASTHHHKAAEMVTDTTVATTL